MSPKIVLLVLQVKGPRLGKTADKIKKKIAVLISSPYKSDLEIEEKERRSKQEKKIEVKAAKKSL